MITKSFTLVFAIAFSAMLSAGQKEEFTIAAPLAPVPGQPVTGTLTEAEARSLVKAVFPDQGGRAYMVHAVRYQSGKLVASTQNWYSVDFGKAIALESAGDLHKASRYQDPRIFGRKNLGIVYLHIVDAAPSASVESALRSDDFRKNILLSMTPGSTDDQLATVSADLKEIAGLKAKDERYKVKLADFNKRLTDLQGQINPNGQATPALTLQIQTLWQDVVTERAIVKLLDTGSVDQWQLTTSGSTKRPLKPWNGYFVESQVDSLDSLSYGISVESKTASPLANLQQILSLAFAGQSGAVHQKEITVSPTPFAAGGTFDTTLVPSNITVTATYTSGGKDTQIGSQTYDDEGRYWYDFSLALPIVSYNDLSYDSSGNTLTAKTIKKNNLYAMVNIGLPRDTKNLNYQLVPTILYGIPIAGQPLKHHIFAASVGLNYVSFFVGTRLDQKNFYHDFSKPLTGANVFQVWRTHLVYGLNFPVGPIVKALTKK